MKKSTFACCLILCAGAAAFGAPPATPPPASAPGQSHPPKKGAEAAVPTAAKGADAADVTAKPKRKPKPEEAEKSPTEIFGDEMDFVRETNIAVFTGNVHVIDRRFDMTSDKLTAYMRKKDSETPVDSATPAAAAPATPAPAATPAPVAKGGGKGTAPAKPAKPATPSSSPAPAAPPVADKTADAAKKAKAGSLQKAIAEGNVVIKQDKPNQDDPTKIDHNIAHARVADYNADTEDMVLRGKPDVHQGANEVIALDENTIINMNRNGDMSVHGPHKMLIYDNSTTTDSKSGNAR